MAAQLPDLPSTQRLSERVVRVLGGNPSRFTLQGTNTYLVGTGPKRILIDTGEGKPVWAEALRDVLWDEKIEVERVLLTHWHHDHIDGVPDLRSIAPQAIIHKNQPKENWEDVQDGQEFEIEGATLRALHCPGHTTDHVAFVLQEEKAMFTGDNVLGHGTAVFEDLAAYMSSLQTMASAPGFSGRAYPGHGDVIEDGPAKVKEYYEHRLQREKEALEVMRRRREDGGEGWGSMEMVKVIYAQYPEALHGPAEGSLRHVLRKLEGEGKVKEVGGKWNLVEGGKERL